MPAAQPDVYGPVASGGGIFAGAVGPVPAFAQGLGDFEVRNLTGATYGPTNGNTSMHDAIPAEWQGGSSGPNNEVVIFTGWSGGKGNAAAKRLTVYGAGHSDGAFGGLGDYDFTGTTKPTGWTIVAGSLSAYADRRPLTNASASAGIYADNRPTAVHSYDMGWDDPVLGRYYQICGSQWSQGEGSAPRYFDRALGAWSTQAAGEYWAPGLTGSKLAGSTLGKSDGTKLLWFSGDYPDGGYFIDTSTGGLTGCTLSFNRNSNGAGCTSVNIGGDNWLTISVMTGAVWLYTHAVDWAAHTVASTQRTHASHATYLTGNDSAAGSLVYDPDHSGGPCVWAFGMVRHCTGTTMSTQMLRIDLSTYAITAHAMTGDAVAVSSGGSAGSYNRHVWFPQWRVIGTVQAYNAPMSIIKLPT